MVFFFFLGKKKEEMKICLYEYYYVNAYVSCLVFHKNITHYALQKEINYIYGFERIYHRFLLFSSKHRRNDKKKKKNEGES